MNLFAVSFFGHRQVDDPFLIERQLESIIRELLLTKEYVEFLVGRDGEFDQLVSSTVRRCKRTIRDDNSSLVLVLPYMTAEYRDNEQAFHEYYDEIEICLESAEKHFKSAHQVRNRSMVDRSDLVIFCIEHNSGGAYQTMQYAKKTDVIQHFGIVRVILLQQIHTELIREIIKVFLIPVILVHHSTISGRKDRISIIKFSIVFISIITL